jgi:ribonuclease HI
MRYYYTDGSATGNGTENSIGGFGIVEVDENNNILWEYQGNNLKYETNNSMELTAILYALNHIEIEEVSFMKPIIYSDSAYCVNLINDWMYSWERNGWKRPKNQEVKNLNLIKQIFELADLAEIRKVKGHSDNKWNEYADKLATGEYKI